jgi:hypothetical protein
MHMPTYGNVNRPYLNGLTLIKHPKMTISGVQYTGVRPLKILMQFVDSNATSTDTTLGGPKYQLDKSKIHLQLECNILFIHPNPNAYPKFWQYLKGIIPML